MKTEFFGSRLRRAASLSLALLPFLWGSAHAGNSEVDSGDAVFSSSPEEWAAEVRRDFVVDLPEQLGAAGKVELEHVVALFASGPEGTLEIAVH
ncbi:MAG: hypothetical protein OSB70_08985 [Myxococcota bacterium]|nr:hypothetical protein [Myxococcota bacterium]